MKNRKNGAKIKKKGEFLAILRLEFQNWIFF